jgi:hypothetical protein
VICIKVHRQGSEVLVAACDEDIVGKTFRGNDLKITVSASFYKGDCGDEDMLVNRLQMATIANLVGRKTMEIAIKHGFVDPENILQIGEVPHAQMARMM